MSIVLWDESESKSSLCTFMSKVEIYDRQHLIFKIKLSKMGTKCPKKDSEWCIYFAILCIRSQFIVLSCSLNRVLTPPAFHLWHLIYIKLDLQDCLILISCVITNPMSSGISCRGGSLHPPGC